MPAIRSRSRQAPRRTNPATHVDRSPSLARRNMTRSRHCVSALLHGSRSMPVLAIAVGEQFCRRFVGLDSHVLIGKRDRAEPAAFAAAQASARCVESDLIACFDAVGESAPRSRRERSAPRKGCGQPRRCRLARPRRETARAPAARRDRGWRRGRSPAKTRRSPPPRFLAMRSGKARAMSAPTLNSVSLSG